MTRDRRKVCPICGDEHLSRWNTLIDNSGQKSRRISSPRQYQCRNGHSFYTGDAIEKYKFKEKQK